jgi:hypothetical protein
MKIILDCDFQWSLIGKKLNIDPLDAREMYLTNILKLNDEHIEIEGNSVHSQGSFGSFVDKEISSDEEDVILSNSVSNSALIAAFRQMSPLSDENSFVKDNEEI